MKKLAYLIGLLLASALTCQQAHAQGGCSMTAHYSEYTSYWISGDANTQYIQTSVLTDGYADVTPQCSIYEVTHTASSYNALGSTGGWDSGSSGCASCYLSDQNDQSIAATLGTDYVFDWTGEVQCSFVGKIFAVSESDLVKVGLTDFILESWDSSNCYYLMYCPNGNTAASCPAANFVDTGGMNQNPPCRTYTYAWVFSLVVNGHCFPVSYSVLSTVPANCQ